jgi:hypothetical protein
MTPQEIEARIDKKAFKEVYDEDFDSYMNEYFHGPSQDAILVDAYKVFEDFCLTQYIPWDHPDSYLLRLGQSDIHIFYQDGDIVYVDWGMDLPKTMIGNDLLNVTKPAIMTEGLLLAHIVAAEGDCGTQRIFWNDFAESFK